MKRVWSTRAGKALVCLAVSLILACGLEWVQLRTQPKDFRTVQKAGGGSTELLDAPVLIDGQGEIDLALASSGEEEAETLAVALAEPAEADISVKAVFTGEDVPKSSQRLIIPAGMDRVAAEIPSGGYSGVKLKFTGSGTVKSAALQGAVSYIREEVKEGFHVLRAAQAALFLFGVLLLLVRFRPVSRMRGLPARGWRNVSGDWKNTLVHLALFLAAFGAVYGLTRWYVPVALGKPFNWMMRGFCVCCGLAAGCLFCFRKTLAKKAEVFFVVLCLLIGGLVAVYNPLYSGNVWDENYHYANALSLSYLGKPRMTAPDAQSMAASGDFSFELAEYDDFCARQDEYYDQGILLYDQTADIRSLGMAPAGIGLFLGRAMGLGYRWTFILGRLFGLGAYAAIGYFAVRRLKSGKMILASVLLIPEALCLAGSYSHDPGVTAWIALGMSWYFAEWQEPEKKLSMGNAAVMILALFLGCLAKPVYFPVLLLPLFLPGKKYRDRRDSPHGQCGNEGSGRVVETGRHGDSPSVTRGRFCGLSALAMVLLVLSFMLPFLLSEDGGGDVRGGEGVNAFGQAVYILQHPREYAGILLRFIPGYLNPDAAQAGITRFGDHGAAPNWVMYVIVMAVAAFTDRAACDDHLAARKGVRIWGALILFAALCIAATSMYVGYTEVGKPSIAGMQARYMIPLLFPAMELAGFRGIRNEGNRAAYNGVLFGVIGFAGFSAVLFQVINLYH